LGVSLAVSTYQAGQMVLMRNGQVIANARWPELLDEGSEVLDTLYALPDEALKEVRFVPERA